MKFVATLSHTVRGSAGLWRLALVIGLMLLVAAVPAEGAAPKISIEQPEGTPLGTGTVIAWGWNNFGQTNVPIGLTGVQAIEAGGNNNVALKSPVVNFPESLFYGVRPSSSVFIRFICG